MMGIFSEGLYDYQTYGDFFQRTSIISFFVYFFMMPFLAFFSLISSFFTMSTFAPNIWQAHLALILFFPIAFIGFKIKNRLILLIAALLSITLTLADLFL